MTRAIGTAVAASLFASAAHGGGVERSAFSTRVLFQEGTYAEFSFGAVSPDVSGNAVAGLGGFPSGDMAADYVQFGAAFRADLNERLSYAIIFDQPYGADVDYAAGTGYFAAGSTASLNSSAVTAMLKYTTPDNFSVYGGLRAQTLSAEAVVPFVDNYSADGAQDEGFGYIFGAAYERPEIALRVALTYISKIRHELDTTETTDTFGADRRSTTTVDTPQQLNLEFQSGVAQDTLVFGAVRWVNWSDFDISPDDYATVTSGGSLVSYDSDTITYALGVGRRLNDAWSVSASASYEAPTGGFASNLGPTDGNTTLNLGAQHTRGNVSISGGVSYAFIGDTETTLDGINAASDFSGNNAIGAGVRVGVTF
ncbi:MAG: outer membrane protein transport protein [Paracoccaceae bacterium]|nr:outer membrane protein transport protein [Paracoccaceae bacterium]